MSADLDQILSDGLRARATAGSPIDPQPLLGAAVARGRRLRARRRVVTATLAAMVVAATASATVLLPRLRPDTAVPAGPSAVDLAKLPDAPGQPGARARPDLVGTDPGVLHVSMNALVSMVGSRGYWSSGAGVETAMVRRGDYSVFLAISRDPARIQPMTGLSGGAETVMSEPAATTVAGRAATVRTSEPRPGVPDRIYSFDWQPVDGLWARYEAQLAAGEDRARQLLQEVSLDRAQRCVTPMRFTYLPAGATVSGCSLIVVADPTGVLELATLTITDGKHKLWVHVADADEVSPAGPLFTAGPYQVWRESSGDQWSLRSGELSVQAVVGDEPIGQDEVLRVLGGLRLSDQPGNPHAW